MAITGYRWNGYRRLADRCFHLSQLPFRGTNRPRVGRFGNERRHSTFVVHSGLYWSSDSVERLEYSAADDPSIKLEDLNRFVTSWYVGSGCRLTELGSHSSPAG